MNVALRAVVLTEARVPEDRGLAVLDDGAGGTSADRLLDVDEGDRLLFRAAQHEQPGRLAG